VCDDNDACTEDSCDPNTGCVYTAIIECDDNNACTEDLCDPNTGCSYTDIDCDDNDACTDDSCDPNTGCVNTPVDCDDNDACTDDSCDPNTGCVNTPVDCDDNNVCTDDSCDPNTGCVNTQIDCDDNDACTDDSCDPNTGCVNLPDFVNVLYATGQEYDGNSQIAEVLFGLDSGAGSAVADPDNWSLDDIVRLQLIDTNADPNNILMSELLVEDIRPALESGETEIAWYVMVEQADSNVVDLSWDPLECTQIDGEDCDYVYTLISELGTSGTVLVADMTDTDSHQTIFPDGESVQYFTILLACEPEPEPEPTPTRRPTGNISPWPGVFPGALGWGGIPFSAGFPGGLPYPMRSGYAPGLSIPSFPGTYTGFTYPGSVTPWTSFRAYTSFIPRFPSTFPTLGIFSPVGLGGWPMNYWTGGYPRPYTYQSGWFYTYR
jgi:hypothetical protein